MESTGKPQIEKLINLRSGRSYCHYSAPCFFIFFVVVVLILCGIEIKIVIGIGFRSVEALYLAGEEEEGQILVGGDMGGLLLLNNKQEQAKSREDKSVFSFLSCRDGFLWCCFSMLLLR